MVVVAWDVETCPIAVTALSSAQHRRRAKEVARQQRRAPELGEDEADRLARSLHPHLAFICCIGAVSGTLEEGPNRPRSWMAESPAAERVLLARFWRAVRGFPRRTRWLTFNGKRFDVPFLLARTAHHGLAPTRFDLLDTYPYRQRPHADLVYAWTQPCSLDDLCDHVGVASSKGAMDGSEVAEAVRTRRLAEVARYAERDVLATFGCLQAMPWLLEM